MRALSIRDPWAQAIVEGPKRVENRTWAPPEHIRGQRIAIHTSKKVEHGDAQNLADLGLFDYRPGEAAPGHIIGVATIVGAIDPDTLRSPSWGTASLNHDRIAEWYVEGQWGWILADVHALTTPVPAKGALGLWRISAEIVERIDRQTWNRKKDTP